MDVEDMLAGDVSFKQARACGYRTTDEFKVDWVRGRDAKWFNAWAFERGGEDPPVDQSRLRFDAKYAHTPCYAITFKLAVDTPRFLASPGRGEVDTHGNADYTRQRHRAIDDLEVVDEATQNRFAKDALGFCIGRQQKRARERAEAKADRGRSMRLAPHERFRRAA